ncbi:MAG: DUF3368 domain-containing protein [Haliscomenobacteraceae bacterium CHB4]|nr:DUF3368 domain-containing protein [Haliscomenobacteraceae bacterium CHB4]
MGLAGVLIEAKDRGIIPNVKMLLDQLIQEANLRISQQIYRRVLDEAGE